MIWLMLGHKHLDYLLHHFSIIIIIVCVWKHLFDMWPNAGDVHGGGEGLQH